MVAKRGIRVVKLSGATSTWGRGGSITARVSETRNEISARFVPSRSIRRMRPPAQKTMVRLSGSQSIDG